MNHHHEHATPTTGLRLLITLILNLLISAAEVIGGLLSGSLSLISDALHNFSDGVAVVISYIAIRLNQKPKTQHYTFGLKRAQIIAAIINSAVLVGISIYLFIESYDRFMHPEPIEAKLMMIVAGIGLVANITGTLLLKAGSKDNMNIRSAYLHLLSDAVSSVGVIVGAIIIYFWNVYWVDPLLTVLISIYILKESYHILKEALDIVLMASPVNIPLDGIQTLVKAIEGINNLHHVHLWQMDEHDIHFEAHVDIADRLVSETDSLLDEIRSILHEHFEINHVTLQFECGSCETTELIIN